MKNTKVGKVNRKCIRKKKLGIVYLKKTTKWHGTESKQKSRCGWNQMEKVYKKHHFIEQKANTSPLQWFVITSEYVFSFGSLFLGLFLYWIWLRYQRKCYQLHKIMKTLKPCLFKVPKHKWRDWTWKVFKDMYLSSVPLNISYLIFF